MQNYPNALKLQILQAELEAHKKAILKLAERLVKEVEEALSLNLELQKRNGNLAELLKNDQFDEVIDEWLSDISIKEEFFLCELDIDKELNDAITKMQHDAYMRMCALFESYKSMAESQLLGKLNEPDKDESDNFIGVSKEKRNILLLAKRLIYEVEITIRCNLVLGKERGETGEIFDTPYDEWMDFLLSTYVQRIKDCTSALEDIGDDLIDEITKMQLKTIDRVVEEVESYKRKAKLEKAHQAGEKAFLTATGTILRLVPTE